MQSPGGMKLKFRTGPRKGEWVDVPATGLTLGREDDNGLQLDEDGISRHHGQILPDGDGWRIEDLQSTNGVRVNGERIDGRCVLEEGDRIGVCSVVMEFTSAVAEGAVTPPGARTLSEDAYAEGEPVPWGRLAVLLVLVGAVIWSTIALFGGGRGLVRGAPEVDAPAVPGLEETTADSGDPDSARTPQATSPTMGLPDRPAPGMPTTPPDPDEPDPRSLSAAKDVPVAIVVQSVPAGAELLIDEEPRGETPVVVTELRPGRHAVTLTKPGYETMTRQLLLPDMLPLPPYELRQKPLTLVVRSEPSGATVVHGRQILGRTPLLLDQFPEGTVSLRFILPGYESLTRDGQISSFRGEELTVSLTPVTTVLEVVTTPSGCQVAVDGVLKGTTRPLEGRDGVSAPLVLTGVAVGEHRVVVTHPAGIQRGGTVTLVAGKTRRLPIRLLVADTVLRLDDGTTLRGMLLEKNESGDVVLAVGPKDTRRFLVSQVRELRKLPPEEVTALPGSVGHGHHGEDDADAGSAPRDVTSQRLARILREANPGEIKEQFLNHMLRIKGVPTRHGQDEFTGFVLFGSKIQCFLVQGHYEDVETQLRFAVDGGDPVYVSGRVVALNPGGLMLRECRVSSMADSDAH